ncbi:protein shisa-5-like [Labeo rohita]|uniref:protein shisa-5-like n=1 Tax=Labeo rohita TaxID=84645 RepID=UPI0021E2BD46|nr:protein shisa-5-like [Labeo rohita]
MEGPSIVPMVVPPIVFFAVFVSVSIIWFCLLKKHMRHTQQAVQSRTTVMTTHHPQYSHHQPMATYLQPAYGGQPILPGPCQQMYAPGSPPTYQEAAGQFPGPYSQAAYDSGQIMYPLQPPVQPVIPTNYTSPQPAYNPAYVESPKTS